MISAFVLGACLVRAQQQPQARRLAQQYQPQNNYPDEEEYQQQPQKQQAAQQYQSRQEGSEGRIRTTTFIPIIRFDKEQGADGSYKAA